MNKFLILVILLGISINNILTGHEQTTHRFIVYQALQLLKLQLGPQVFNGDDFFSLMNQYIGDMNDNNDGNANSNWTITGGAYNEDERDVVWRHGESIYNGDPRRLMLASVSHFCNPFLWFTYRNDYVTHAIDYSGTYENLFINLSSNDDLDNVQTASFKLKKYIEDGFEWRTVSDPGCTENIEYPGLIEYYGGGRYKIRTTTCTAPA